MKLGEIAEYAADEEHKLGVATAIAQFTKKWAHTSTSNWLYVMLHGVDHSRLEFFNVCPFALLHRNAFFHTRNR